MTQAPPPRFNFWNILGGRTLLEEHRFRRLWEQHILGQMGTYAVNYSLLILVIRNTGSGVLTGLFIIVYTLPAAMLGPISGVIVDRLSRGFVLAATNVARMLLCIAVVLSSDSTPMLYLFALGFSALSQFNSPAISASLPLVVEQNELTTANSLINLGGLFAEAIGIVALAALMLKTVGVDPLFVVLAILFASAAFLAGSIRGLTERATGRQLQRAMRAGVRLQFARAWQRLRDDSTSYLALIVSIVTTSALLVGVVVLPRYAKDELNVSPENIIFVFSPAAIGIFAGLRSVNALSLLIGKVRAQALGFTIFVISLVAFGFVAKEASAFIDWNPLGVADPGPLNGRGARIGITMIAAILAGFGSSLTSVASRAIINERIPLEMQGRVFAAQNVLINVTSVAPLLVAGALADLVGVRPVLVGTAVLLTLFVSWAALRAKSVPSAMGV